jgi:hypothetical protein
MTLADRFIGLPADLSRTVLRLTCYCFDMGPAVFPYPRVPLFNNALGPQSIHVWDIRHHIWDTVNTDIG